MKPIHTQNKGKKCPAKRRLKTLQHHQAKTGLSFFLPVHLFAQEIIEATVTNTFFQTK